MSFPIKQDLSIYNFSCYHYKRLTPQVLDVLPTTCCCSSPKVKTVVVYNLFYAAYNLSGFMGCLCGTCTIWLHAKTLGILLVEWGPLEPTFSNIHLGRFDGTCMPMPLHVSLLSPLPNYPTFKLHWTCNHGDGGQGICEPLLKWTTRQADIQMIEIVILGWMTPQIM
jgi:hypothetical protein